MGNRNINTDNHGYNYFTKLHEGIMKLHEEKESMTSWIFVPSSWIFV